MSRSSVGFEAELFLINHKGEISPKADEVIELTQKLTHKPVKEYAKEVIEINAYPSQIIESSLIEYINTFYEIDEIISKKDLYLLPISVYPNDYVPKTREGLRYEIREKMWGKEKMEKAARVVGFHFHYPIPGNLEKFLNSYNFLIAIVPIFDLFMQSSPFFKQEVVAKDVRAFLYRDMKVDGIEGIYYPESIFGGLPKYEESFESLISTLKRRIFSYRKLLIEAGVELSKFREAGGENPYWGAVRINPRVKTFELRSPDINLPSYLLEGLILFKELMDFSMKNEIRFSSNEKFLVEEGVIFLPSFEAVKRASYESCLKGFESYFALEYATSLLSNLKLEGLSLIKKMLEEKKSFSDFLIKEVGGESVFEEEEGREVSLKIAEKMLEEMDRVREKALKHLSSLESIVVSEDDLTYKILEALGKEERKKLDIARSFPSRLEKIKAIIFSPYLADYLKGKGLSLEKLKKHFLIITPTFSKENLGFFEKIGVRSFKVEKEDFANAIKGWVKVWGEANNISRNEVLFFAIKKEDEPLINYFGASATFLNNKEIKELVEVLVESLEELPSFLGRAEKE